MPERQQVFKKPRARPTFPGISREATEPLFEHAPEAMFVVDRAGKIAEVNSAACQLQGGSRERLVGANFVQLAAKDCRQQLAFLCLPLPLVEHGHALRCAWLTAGGEMPVELHVSPIAWAGQDMALVRVRDLGECLHLESELSRSEQRFVALFDANPSPMWVCDAESLAFVAVNE